MKKYYLDTNVILRFLLQDHNELFLKAQYNFTRAKAKKIQLVILEEVFFEIDYVLRGVYSMSKPEVVKILLKLALTPYLNVVDRSLLVQVLKKYNKVNVDLFDVYLFEKARIDNASVISFDNDFQKIERLG